MSADVVQLPGAAAPPDAPEPDPSVVQAVERLLQLARSGQLQELCATGFLEDGNRYLVLAGDPRDRFRTLGALAILPVEFHDWQEGGAEGSAGA